MLKWLVVAIVVLTLAGCTGNPTSTIAYDALPTEGDPVNGERLYTARSCNACHVAGASGAPDLEGYGERAGDIVPDQDAREYTFYSIVEPAQHIAEGYGNAMPNNYDEIMTPQEIADLIAYLLDL
ncbi:MAG: c-type cytochrome [Anaerolineae bacterium]